MHNEHNRPLLLRRRRHRLTEESLRKALALGEKSLWQERPESVHQVTTKELARIRRVILGILPYVKVTSLNRDANLATTVCSDTEADGQPIKKSKKSGGKDQLPY